MCMHNASIQWKNHKRTCLSIHVCRKGVRKDMFRLGITIHIAIVKGHVNKYKTVYIHKTGHIIKDKFMFKKNKQTEFIANYNLIY